MRKDLGLYKLSGEGEKKRYSYCGAYYVPPFMPPELLRIKVFLLLGCIFQAFLVFLMGKLNFPSFRKLYVIIPFLGVVFIAGKVLFAAASLFSWKDRMTFRQHQISWHSLASLSRISMAAGTLLLAGVAVDVLFLGGSLNKEWPMLLLSFLQISLSTILHCIMKRRPCTVDRSLEIPSASETQSRISGESVSKKSL